MSRDITQAGGTVALTEPPPSPILIVDDNAAARYTTGRVLRAAGYQVLEAATGTAALEQAAGVDLVILDINLPDIDGFEVCRRLRANPATAHVAVLHLSATFVHHGDFNIGLQAGADSYLTRPVEATVLIASVRTLLFARRAELQRRSIEARLQEIFDLMPVPMLTLNGSFHIESVNPAFCALSGYDRSELIGRSGDSLFEASDLTEQARSQRATALAPDGRWTGRAAVRRSDASTVPVDWQLARESAGGMLILTLTDISARLRGETEREALLSSERAARAEAERSNRLKEEFLATLSHELRTPLSAILGWSAVINRTEGLPATVAQGVQAIERNSRLQAQMINDLLDYAGIAYGKLRLAMAVIDPYAVIRAAVDVVQGIAQGAGVQLSASIVADGAHVEADPARLQQMVWNLLTNAIKFSPRGGTVQLRAGVENGRLHVVVRDQGQGIAAHFLPRIFERFSQQDATSKRRHGGLGLGLAIVKQIAELHGGTVTAFSEGEGRGATFTLELPVAQGRAASTLISDTQLQRSQDLSGVVVLLVEDDVDARELTCRVLGDAGAQVVEVASAQAALQVLESADAQVLVSDIGMAGEDGYELIRQVRARGYGPERLPAIALTAFARVQDREDAIAAGFQDHVVKPFDAQSLILSVASVRPAARPPKG
ncbi:MAG TPA: response regulator [Steroidobacteraceae bacterium]|jgi:hypothetical protein|nr:response regulator [Steroidobacteraceae bacterium]